MIPELIFENHRVIEDKYFRADETFPGVYKISQPWFREDSLHVYCFLIVGSKAAIVYDSMFGYGNLRAFCEKITDKPLLMVNSHFHGDHSAGNFDFDSCYIHPYDLPGIYQGFAKTREELLQHARERERQGKDNHRPRHRTVQHINRHLLLNIHHLPPPSAFSAS